MAEAYTYPDEDLTEDAPEPANDRRADVQKLIANIRSPNIAADLDASELATIGAKVVEEYKIDLTQREGEGWDKRNEDAMKLALQVKEAKNTPWANASNVKFPLLTTAAIQFAARAYPAIVDGNAVVKGKALGEDSGVPEVDPRTGQPAMGPNGEPVWRVKPGAKKARADRVARHMSWQLLEEMSGWEEDTDRLLHMLPITGCVIRKTWFDPVKGYNCSYLVSPDKFVVGYWTKDLETCPRATQVCEYYPHEIEEKFRGDVWVRPPGDLGFGTAPDASNDDQAPHTFLEQHRLLDLDDDGYPEPYIVTVHKDTMQTVRIVARYDEEGVKANAAGEVVSIKPVRYFTKYGFIPSPDGCFYDIGFGQLLNALNGTINTTINQLIDAGTLSNTQGGWFGSGLSIKSGNARFGPGEWKKADVTGGTLKDNIVPLPAVPPSAVLFNLLGMLIEAARDITATKDILTGETQGTNQPVGTTLAMIEQGLKVFTAIYKRIHRSMKQELACLYRLNRIFLPQESYFAFQDTPEAISQRDYADDIDVLPVSDPTVVHDMQKIGRAQYLMQFLGQPNMDTKAIQTRALEAASIPNIEDLFTKEPPPPDPKLLIEMKKLEQDGRRIDIEDRKLKLLEASTTADSTGKYAGAIAQLSGAGGGLGVSPEALLLSALLHNQATQETSTNDGPAPEVQPGDVRGMAGPPPHPDAAPVLQGPAAGIGPPMGDGGGDGPPLADEGYPDGGAVDLGMGGPGDVLQPVGGA